jgi:hypothetical protein
LLAVPASAAILPDEFAGAAKTEVKPIQAPDAALFDEYGFDAGEQATYGPVTVKAWRFRDSTGAYSGYLWTRADGSRPFETELVKVGARTGARAFVHHGNYLFEFAGKMPSDEDLAALFNVLPKWEPSSLPVISTYLPPEGLIPNSERYILGPESLAKSAPQIPPSVAAFHLSAEAQYSRYRANGGEMSLLIFSYPTPNMARERVEAFGKLPATVAKRTGPLVALVQNATDPDAAERLLGRVSYQASLTLNEATPSQQARSLARMILDMMLLSGLVIGCCILGGVIFAAARILIRRGARAEGEHMITLHIEGK